MPLAALLAGMAIAVPAPGPGPAWLTGIAEAESDPDAVLERILSASRHPWLRWGDLRDVARDLASLRDAQPGGLVWFDGARPVPAFFTAVRVLADASQWGLDPDDYDAALLSREAEGIAAGKALSVGESVRLDSALSIGVLRFLSAVHRGRAVPHRAGLVGKEALKPMDLPRLVREARDGDRMGKLVSSLEPQYPGYARLKAALATYRSMAEVALPGAEPFEGPVPEAIAVVTGVLVVAAAVVEPGPLDVRKMAKIRSACRSSW
jgi:hypothetical protein